tara:strand:+ start:989 stop:1699 length:711 start_codon:yes stop_codon:yes gene_type:complete
MPRPKSKKNMYFDMDVQDAIIEYNQSEDDDFRSKIYNDRIHYAFDKLSENIINTFKFMYFDDKFEDVKHEVTTFLVMNMHKYDHTKGSKAFSYFSIVAKNYLILHNNNNYKKLKKHVDISKVYTVFNNDDVKQEEINVFINELILYFEKKIPLMFKKKKDIDIAFSILELLKKRDYLENFNKKALYVLIREMTDVETSHITKVVNVFKKQYKKVLNNYAKQGRIPIPFDENNNPYF